LIGKKSPRRFFQTSLRRPPAKGVTFAGCLFDWKKVAKALFSDITRVRRRQKA
jgi:hypothetical protein